MAVSEWGEVIEYLDGYAWGITPSGGTVCLGRETAVKAAIANPQLKCGKPEVDAIIELERILLEDIKTQNGKQPNIQRPGAFRNRTDGKTKHRAAHIKPAAFRKRLPGNPSKH